MKIELISMADNQEIIRSRIAARHGVRCRNCQCSLTFRWKPPLRHYYHIEYYAGGHRSHRTCDAHKCDKPEVGAP